jgi:hypothetical protein
MDKLIRFTVAFGHRDLVSSGPGRTPSQVIVSYVPEVIGSGVSTLWSGVRACSGVCIVFGGASDLGASLSVHGRMDSHSGPRNGAHLCALPQSGAIWRRFLRPMLWGLGRRLADFLV